MYGKITTMAFLIKSVGCGFEVLISVMGVLIITSTSHSRSVLVPDQKDLPVRQSKNPPLTQNPYSQDFATQVDGGG